MAKRRYILCNECTSAVPGGGGAKSQSPNSRLYKGGSLGVILHRGPSSIDGAPIVVIATGIERVSNNRKTGPMVQIYYIREDIHPLNALKSGQDYSVCGDCSLRGLNGTGRACYVNLSRQGVNVIWINLQSYGTASIDILKGRRIRLGAYGDPVAVSYELTERIAKTASAVVGYTHQWRTCDQRFRNWLKASCDTEYERVEANSLGWSTYRIKQPEQELLPGEVLCKNQLKGDVCYSCKLCTGKNRIDVAINVHGNGKMHYMRRSK